MHSLEDQRLLDPRVLNVTRGEAVIVLRSAFVSELLRVFNLNPLVGHC